MFKTQVKGRVVDPAVLDEVAELIGINKQPERAKQTWLIENLHAIQDAHQCVRKKHLVALAQWMNLSMSEVYEVATFYHHFLVLDDDAVNPAPITVRVCESLSCAMAGADERFAELSGLKKSQFRVVKAPCLGLCAYAPAAVVGEFVPTDKSAKTLEQQARKDVTSLTVASIPSVAQSLASYAKKGGYQGFADVYSGKRSAEDLIEQLTQAQLRGLGGAGFPSARKWQAVRAQPGEHVMVVNVDEGEVGTFKDKYYLEREPHRFIEGMLIAAFCVQASEVYVYVRDEYPGVRKLLARELAVARRYLAKLELPMPPVHLRRGAGAYICGEESALIESLEGKRGEPRLKPPIVAHVGLFGLPTLAHNPETLMWVVDILSKGADWYRGLGTRGRAGLRSFSVSGRVNKPGVYPAPSGATLNELIALAGGMQDGHTLTAFLPGGASGGILPASLANEPLDFDVLAQYGAFIGSAAVVVLSQQDKPAEAAANLMHFFAEESCGQCTPCRNGTKQALMLMEESKDEPWAGARKNTLNDLADVMADASICGLGQAAANPIRSVIRFFPGAAA